MTEKVYIEEAGCNRRKLDLERIRAYLELNGYFLVHKPEAADRILVSTCAFKKKEEDDAVARLEALRQYAGKTVVFGCLPDIAPERFALFDLPNIAPKELEKIESHFAGMQQHFADVSDAHVLPHGRILPSWRNLRRNLVSAGSNGGLVTRDFLHQTAVTVGQRLRELLHKSPECFYLTVCRGCLGKCSFCAIRRSIGAVKSKPVAAVLDDFRDGVARGFRDFAVQGDDLGCYGVDIGSSFPALLEALGAECAVVGEQAARGSQGFNRMGLHLKEVHPKFLIAHADSLVKGRGLVHVKSLLCPIQSGSDRILQLMAREHTMAELGSLLRTLKKRNPDTALTSQIIVGFPGETETDFRATLEAVCDNAFASVVVFPYDRKPGTAAAELPAQVPSVVVRKRMREAFLYFRAHKVQALYNCPP